MGFQFLLRSNGEDKKGISSGKLRPYVCSLSVVMSWTLNNICTCTYNVQLAYGPVRIQVIVGPEYPLLIVRGI